MALLGGTGATNVPVASSVNTTTPIGGDGTSGNPVNFTPYDSPVFYVDPVTGNDSNNGSIGAPFLTVDKANRVLNPGWRGFATINLRSGNSVIGAKTVWPSPLGGNTTTAGGLLINGMDNTDSGLGARTAAGGTAGTNLVFGTLIDSVGGFAVNAFRGQFIRFTSGATLNTRSFLIVSNTANTFTIAGTFTVAPTVETFVVETPGATLSWAGTEVMQAEGAVGFQNVAFSGGGGANALRLSRGIFGAQRCTLAAIGTGGVQLRNSAVFQDLNAMTALFGTFTILQQCGLFFNTVPISIAPSSATGMYPVGMNFNRSFLLDSPTECFGPQTLQFLGTQLQGNSYIRAIYGSNLLLGQCRFETVTPSNALATAFIGAFGAAIVASKRSNAGLFNVTVNNTPATFGAGDAILIEDGSTGQFTAVQGAGNAGLGARIVNLSQARVQGGANTVTGAAGDVKIGANAAVLWAALAAINTDPVQLCIGGP